MKVFDLFVSKYPPGNDLRKPTAETLEQFQGKVPAELLNFWQEYGFGNYGGGLLKIIDPTDYIDTLTLWLGEQEGCLPILMTGFGTLLHKVSRIGFLKKKIVEQVRERGCFYRVKTFIDIITNPMLVSMENLLNQSLLNSAQGRIVLSKKRQLAVWKDGFKATGKNRIRSLLINLKSQLNGEIAAFAEEHFDDKNADKAWNRLLQEKGIQDNCQTLLTELEETCNDKIPVCTG